MRFLILGLAFACLTGCGRGGDKTRSTDEIFAEKQKLPRLYLSAKTHTRVVAPASKGMFKDAKTGEECWPAQQCTNPDCPGRNGDEPSLFICYDISEYHGCPACAKQRNYKADSAADKNKYLKFVKDYELPETRARMKVLDEEYKRASDAEAIRPRTGK